MNQNINTLTKFVKKSRKWSRWITPKAEVFYVGEEDKDNAMIYVEYGVLRDKYYICGKIQGEQYSTFSRPKSVIKELFEEIRENYWRNKVKQNEKYTR